MREAVFGSRQPVRSFREREGAKIAFAFFVLDLVMIMVLCAELPPGKKHPK